MHKFYGPKQEILLLTSFDMDRAIIFLPGISGGAHSARFLPIDKLAEEDGYACARIALWEGEEDVKIMSYDNIFTRLDELFLELEKLDFLDFMLIGKSFGGGVALAYEHPKISSKVLWAPAIGIGEGEGNWAEVKTQSLGEFNNLLDIKLGTNQIKAQNIPIGIVHGTADEAFPVSNSEAIIAACSNGTLKTITGAGHSFKDHEHEVELMALTHQLLH